jgi:hypothetical protein
VVRSDDKKTDSGEIELRNQRVTVSLALLRPSHEGGSVRVSAQTRATESVVIMRLQMRETLDYKGCRPVDESQR